LGPLEGLTLETMMLAPLALVYMGWGLGQGNSVILQGDWSTNLWLMVGGPLTAIPLLLFAAGARRIPLTTLGILQYSAPTVQFILSVVVFHEPINSTRLWGFILIWAALVVYSLEGLHFNRQSRKQVLA
jgi:chloramphenicol-sensitive protein RarD